jgi:signal transduction histidine kinase
VSADRTFSGERLLGIGGLRWLAIVAPGTFLVFVVYLLRGPFHEELHEFPGYVLVIATLTVAVAAFSFLVFGMVARLERRVLDQNQELTALLAVGRAITSSLDASDQLADTLDTIISVTSADAAELWLVDGTEELLLAQSRGFTEALAPPGTRLRLGEGIQGLAAARGVTVSSREVSSAPESEQRISAYCGFETVAASPLKQGERCVGVLLLAAGHEKRLADAAEQRLLEGISTQLAVAVENARLHERVLDRAVLEERERLARELHDSLGQLLGYVNTQTMAIKKLLTSGREEEARRQVQEMETNARAVYTDVREAIRGLRTTTPGLLPSLRSYLKDFQLDSGPTASLEVTDDVTALSLPDAVEIQVIRIIQEALTNVRKHAAARAVTVHLSVQDERLIVRIEDDGCGFDLERPVRTGWPHFGLQTMRERATAVGGSLAVETSPDNGTVVVVDVPGNGTMGGLHARRHR